MSVRVARGFGRQFVTHWSLRLDDDGRGHRRGRPSTRRPAPPIAPGLRLRPAAVAICWAIATALPLIGLVSLLWRAEMDPQWNNHRVHFVLFLAVAALDVVLGYAAGEAADRRGDARVLLISLAFLATGGFLGLHASAPRAFCSTSRYAGFRVAIPVGSFVAALFGAASAFVEGRPRYAPLVVRRRATLRRAVLVAMAVWFSWTVAELPPLDAPEQRGRHAQSADCARRAGHGPLRDGRGSLLASIDIA